MDGRLVPGNREVAGNHGRLAIAGSRRSPSSPEPAPSCMCAPRVMSGILRGARLTRPRLRCTGGRGAVASGRDDRASVVGTGSAFGGADVSVTPAFPRLFVIAARNDGNPRFLERQLRTSAEEQAAESTTGWVFGIARIAQPSRRGRSHFSRLCPPRPRRGLRGMDVSLNEYHKSRGPRGSGVAGSSAVIIPSSERDLEARVDPLDRVDDPRSLDRERVSHRLGGSSPRVVASRDLFHLGDLDLDRPVREEVVDTAVGTTTQPHLARWPRRRRSRLRGSCARVP